MSDSDTSRHNGRTARELASDAENNLRGIVHLAETDTAPPDARQIFGTLSGITRMLGHVPEVVTRLRSVVMQQHESGNLSVMAGPFAGDPDAAVHALTDSIDVVLVALGAVQTNMEKAQASLSDANFTRGAHGDTV